LLNERGKAKVYMKKIIVMLLISALLLILGLAVKPVVSGATLVKVDPSLTEYHEDATGQQFTVAVKIVDVTNLYGFDIKFRWNTTYLDYVSYSILVPNDTYPGGVLWNPIVFAMNDVNTTAGTYWTAYSSRYPAPTFNGSGTVFTMTFKVKHHPVQPEPDANITLELYSTDLSAPGGSSIPHTTQDGTVILHALTAHHDVAVTDVKPSKTVIGQGSTCNISITVTNQGGFTETSNVTVYANTTATATPINVTLPSGNSMTITFTWNTTGFAKGNYTISAVADTVQGETNTTNNTYTDGLVLVTIIGDVDGNGNVNVLDAIDVSNSFGKSTGQAGFNANADFDDNDVINILDAITLANNFGQHYP
jgi:hypothetical protein